MDKPDRNPYNADALMTATLLNAAQGKRRAERVGERKPRMKKKYLFSRGKCRNMKCACGSGKKFKHCCGRSRTEFVKEEK